jgi:uncharacterized protein
MSKVIISDTSCLIALDKIGLLHILKDLYQEVVITKEVQEEFGQHLPEWVTVSIVRDQNKQAELEKIVDKGEASSITHGFSKYLLVTTVIVELLKSFCNCLP